MDFDSESHAPWNYRVCRGRERARPDQDGNPPRTDEGRILFDVSDVKGYIPDLEEERSLTMNNNNRAPAHRVELSRNRATGARSWRLHVLSITAAAGMVATSAAQGQGDGPTPGPGASPMVLEPKGSLVIVGGGGTPDAVRKKFIDLAGGAAKAKIVVIPTAGEDADSTKESDMEEYLEPWRKQGAASLLLLHTRSHEKANDPEFTRAIDEATGVWFGGGDQSRITEAYLGTNAEKAFRRVLERGGVIGGTSAGAAIMSKVMITGGGEKATAGAGLGYLPGAVVDQHALKRSRLNRLVGVVADHPELIGIAIDEATALVVEPDEWHVLGKSYVVFYRPATSASPQRIDFFQEGDHGEFGDWKSPPSNTRFD